uniref:LRRCT domain-containing protein n=1 Tax=Branchiostoma floridae TaxID=7739 RepID=C3Z256_BRAFL|eukprot:XP_002597095.1 hypothetical protein BRAFLDRAFT_76374 [Branchiostoma floridae]
MAVKFMAKVCLLLLLQLLVPRIDAGSWQSCREVSVAKCGVGDSRSDGHEYRRNIMIVDNDVGELDTQKAELLSQIPCGRDCRLWFVGCNLTEIEGGAFAELPQVSTLVIWRSNVQTLRNGTFAGMDGLKKLLLFENNLAHLEDGCLDGLPSLSHLILVDNQILTLSPDTFRGVQPYWIDVSANFISNVPPGTLQAIKSVEYVHAAENKLTAIGAGMFHGLERLLVLNLEGNRISHIAAGAFSTNTKLSNLDLARNRLTFLSGGWFRSTFPTRLMARGNAIAVVALEDRALRSKRVILDNPPRCTCANDQLYEHQGNTLEFKQRFISAIRVLSTTSCPASALNLNSPVPVNPRSLPCPAPLVVIVNVERSAAYNYEAVGDVYWEQSPIVSLAFPNGLHHEVDMTYDTNTTTHDRLATGNLTNTTCTASSETGSHTAVFMESERAHSGITTPQATELSLMNMTLYSTIISTTLPLTNISTTPLSTSASDDSYKDLMRYIRSAAIGLLSPLALLGVWGCAMYIWRRLRRKAPGNPSGPLRNGNQITACSRWPVGDQGNMDESVISPYAEGGFDDHDSLNDSESVISPYAEGGFADHPDLRRADSSQSETVPYGEAKLCAAYAGRARAQTHPVPSRPYSTERPRQTPNREGAVLAAYGPNGRDKSGKKCYQHPSILPNPGATQSSAYQQNARVAKRSRKAPCYNSPVLATDQERTLSNTYDQNDPREAAKGSRKAPCYNSPALATDQERTLSSTYDQNDPREAAKGSRKAPSYNSPALATDQERTLSSTYDQNDRSEAVCNSAESPGANSYQPATSPSSESGTQSTIYDENHRSGPTTGRGDSSICPSPAASADRSPAAAYSQNDRREAINDTPDSPETNSYESAHCAIQ